jgi:hypothetical protein
MKFLAAQSSRLFAVAALFVAASTPSLAADPQPQRLALSCASAPHAMGCVQREHGAAPVRTSHVAPAVKTAKMPAARKTLGTQDLNDGSRFTYDSCGCSGV